MSVFGITLFLFLVWLINKYKKFSKRQDVISGQNKSRVDANVATNYGKSKIRTAGPSASSLNASRTKLQQQRNQTNQARVWENTDEQDCK